MELFNQNDILYLDDKNSPCIEDRKGDFDEIAENTIEAFFSSEKINQFDILHFLFSDDILGPLYRHSPNTGGPQLVGELNGVFFERKTLMRQRYSHQLFMPLLRSPARSFIDFMIPVHTNYEQQWRDLYLYRCLNERIFNHLIVHSDEADEYVSNLNQKKTTRIRKIPYPAPEDFGTEISQREARDRLDLPVKDPILLFFGTLREQKGINHLLRVLRQYRGPEFTVHIVGPPHSVSKEQVRSVKNTSTLNIITELNYINNPEVYFRAADAIVLPYIRKFGKECTSQTLEEATSSLRPVIVPEFGTIGRVTKEWDLGMTYEQGSDEALATALAKFARDEISYSEENMEQYNRLHSYEQAATELVSIYTNGK